MLISSIPCGSKMSDYVLLKTVKIYLLLKTKLCAFMLFVVYM